MINILITNDDGIHSPGIFKLKSTLEKIANVWVVAPDTERSAVGHAITLSDPLRVEKVDKNDKFFGYSVNGTPADCVKLGIRCLVDTKPDIVVSGINLGPNTATNVIYSGTVSAAAESVIMGIPALALSLTSFTIQEYDYTCKLAVELVQKIIRFGLPEGTLLNVNIPPLKEDQIEGISITRQGKGRYEEFFDKENSFEEFSFIASWEKSREALKKYYVINPEITINDKTINPSSVAKTLVVDLLAKELDLEDISLYLRPSDIIKDFLLEL